VGNYNQQLVSLAGESREKL